MTLAAETLDGYVIKTLDCNDRQNPWRLLTDAQRARHCNHLLEHGIDPMVTHTVDFLVVDTGALRVGQYEADQDGRPKVHRDPATGKWEPIWKAPFLVPCAHPEWFQ